MNIKFFVCSLMLGLVASCIRFSFKSFCNQHKPGLKIFDVDGYRGLKTFSPIRENEIFLRIPLENTFYVIEEDCNPNLDSKWPLQLAQIIALELENTKKCGENKWSSYFSLLPSQESFEKDLPHHWSESDISVFLHDYEKDHDNIYDSALICEGIDDAKKSEKKQGA